MIKPATWLWTAILLLVLGGSAHAQMIAVDDEFSVPFGAQLVVEAPGVLNNDTFDGEPAEDAGATAVLVDDVFYGFLSLASDGSFTYTPDSTFPGIDSFTYQAVVGGDTSLAKVTLTACSAGPGAGQTVCWKEGPYLAKLGELGYRSFQEGFENDAAWGSVRSPSTALLVVSQGVEWQTNHPAPPASNGITTGTGPARTGLWGVYDPAHGYATGLPATCDVDVPPPECLYHDGFTGTRQSGESTLYGVGGHFTGSLGPSLVMILDGGTAIGLGLVPTGDPTFFGVIDTAGFTSFRVQETDGKIGQTRLVFGDDFVLGTSPADTTPPQVSLVNSVADTGDGILAESEVTAVPITQLLVSFDELVSELGGETAPHSVTNVANYLLFSDGGDGFDTVDCSTGVDAADNAVTVDWVTYTSGSERTATLDINGGGALGSGNYRLLVCGTTSIKDWAGNTLDGDGNGTGGDDFARSFTVTGSPGSLQFSSPTYSVAENGTSATITVTRTGGSFGAASVDYATADGSATAGSDYTAASGTLSWIDGDGTSKIFVVPIIDDTTYEGDETVNLSLTNATGASLGSPSAATLTITENDPVPPAGSLQFSLSAYSVAENGTSATITVTRTGGSFGAASVDYATSDGSATAGSDYTAASGTLNWIDGDATSKTFVVPIIDDTTYEGDETVNLSLSNASGATLGAPSSAVLTITENDPVPPSGSLQFSSPTYSVAENGTSVLITVTRTGGSFGAASVDYATADGSATAGSDYTAASGTLNWIDGDATSKSFSVAIIDDTTYEGDETVNLSLSNVSGATLGAPSSAVLTITENDPVPPSGSLQFSSPTYSVAENGTSATITVTRIGGSFGAASVDYATADGSATAGSDYTAASGTLNWIDGDATSKTFVVAIIDDTTYEGDETVNLSLSNVSGATLGAPSSAVLTITENDPVPPSGSLQYSSPTYSVAENGTSVMITVTRIGGSFGAASVDYATADGSATAGSDYTATSGTLNWIDGDATSKSFSVAIIDDTTYEGDETVNLSLSNVSGATLGAPSSAVLTITENDPVPPSGSLQYSSPTYSVAENGTSATITVTRIGGSFGAASVDYATADGSATAGSDYTAASGTLNWIDGDATSKTFVVAIIDDTTYEGDETVNLSLSNVSGATLGAPSSAVLTITENDPVPPSGSLQYSSPTYSVAENGTSVLITVTRTGGSFGAASVDYATADGSATAGSDYTAASGTLNWIDGDATSKSFSVAIIDDTTYEGDETVNLSLSNVSGATLGAPSSAVLTITENDPVPPSGSLQFSSPTYSVAENGTSATITVTRIGGSFGAASVDYATADGSATAGSDYTAASGTLNWIDGDATSKTFVVAIIDDTTYEGDETVNLSLSNVSGATLGAPSSAVLTITENDPVPPSGSLQYSSPTYSVAENGTSVMITVTRIGGSFGAASVDYATADGSATAGSDYTATSGTLNWIDGDATSKSFSVAIIDDTTYEGDETVNLSLSNVSGATLGAPSSAVLTITENDPVPPSGSLQYSSPTYSVAENGTSVMITVTRIGGSFGAASVDYATADGSATAGSDYTATSGTLNWIDGDATSKSFSVAIIDDTTYEGDETVNLSLSNASGATLGAPSSAVLTITENDPVPPSGSLQFSSPTYSVAENGTSVMITVTRTGGSFGAASVDYATADGSATAGSDYTATSGTLNWIDGDATSKTFVVPIIDDTTYEGDETVNLSLTNATGATLGTPNSAVLTIAENDPVPPAGSVQFSLSAYSVAENGTSATITVTRTGGSFGAASVDYATSDGSATAGSDYTAASGTLNWIDGDATSKTFVVPIIDDTTYEGDETVNLSLTNATGATLGSPSAAVLTITENDPVPPAGSVQFSLSAYSVAENGTSATITVTRTGGSFGAASVNYATADGSATAGSDYTAASGTLNWIDGDATSKIFIVPMIDDTTYEGDETVNLSLTNATGATLGAPSSAVLTIIEDDPAGSTTWYVATTGSDVADCITPLTPCRTIGEAVFRAISGDTIQVASGVYSEALMLSKSLTLIGHGVNPVLDGTGADVVVSVSGGVTVSINNFEIRNGAVGGVENLGTIDLFECRIHANGDGSGSTFGGVANSGTARIERSTVDGNFGDASGGIDNSGQLEVVNSTIQGNQAVFAPGILNSTGADLDIRYSTVAENGTYGIRGAGTVNMEATIIALHGITNCEFAVNTLGNNLEDRDSCGFDPPSGDIINADPLLRPLGQAGGPTPTMALQVGSAAIDTGAAAVCEATDQRGVGRPVDGDKNGSAVCDIGAFEFQPDVIFEDGFESGNLSAWDSVVGGP